METNKRISRIRKNLTKQDVIKVGDCFVIGDLTPERGIKIDIGPCYIFIASGTFNRNWAGAFLVSHDCELYGDSDFDFKNEWENITITGRKGVMNTTMYDCIATIKNAEIIRK